VISEGRKEVVGVLRALRGLAVFAILAAPAYAQELPELTRPVNDFANVVDPASEQRMEAIIRSLQQTTGDVVVVATVDTIAPYGNTREYANKLFENRGRGIGQRGKDNGLLIVLAVRERRVEVEVGYDLEQFITDGFSGETSRQYMAPEFRSGNYGAGLLAGVERIVSRIAEQRNVTLQGVPRARARARAPQTGSGGSLVFALFVAFMVINAIAGRLRGKRYGRRWGGGGGGWNSGVGPFGGGFGGGLGGGGGFGGGFGGFGGGRSGGGGGGASW
jgi:uncharacterized protein